MVIFHRNNFRQRILRGSSLFLLVTFGCGLIRLRNNLDRSDYKSDNVVEVLDSGAVEAPEIDSQTLMMVQKQNDTYIVLFLRR